VALTPLGARALLGLPAGELAWLDVPAEAVTSHPDELHDRAKTAGAEIISPQHDTDNGSRDFAARDPEGNRWSFGTYRGEPRKTV
jgi:uncharacterized glyoxalase superfamily protein PhnB